jgi:hypothetical protein
MNALLRGADRDPTRRTARASGARGPRSRLCALLLALLTLSAARAFCHDIPRDVTVQAFARPEGGTLRLIVRVPLKAIMDVEFPRRERDYVDIPRADQSLRDAAKVWLADKLELYEGGTRLSDPRIAAVRMSLESDRSFATYNEALAHVTGPPLPPDTTIFWEQGLMDVLFEYPIHSDRAAFSIHAAFDRLGLTVLTVLRFLPPGGVIRAFELQGDAGLVRLDPRWHQAALRFVSLGFFHILDGVDHLLFLLCLVIPFRRARALIPIVTSFTVAHSVTLIASAYNYAPDALWFPPLIETLIAMSIVYMALENIVAAQLARRWVITFLFGLVHGFGFSFGLQHTLQFAGSHLLTSLLSFNVGVELGQLLVLALFVPALDLLFRFVVAERMGVIIVSALVAHTGWHWMTERFDMLRQFPWPAVTAAGLASGIRWLMLLVAFAAVAWLVYALSQRADNARSGESPVGAGE